MDTSKKQAKDKSKKRFKLLTDLEYKKKLKKGRRFFIYKTFKTPFSSGIFRIWLPLATLVTFFLMVFYGRGEEGRLFLMSPFLLVPIKLVKLVFKTEGFFLSFLIVSLFFSLTPIAIAFFQYFITRNRQITFFSTLLFCVTFWWALLINQIDSPRVLLKFAEGEHIAAPPVLLTATLFFWNFLKVGTVKKLLAASVSIGFLVLFSKTAFLAFLVFLGIFSLSEIFLKSTKTTLKRVILAFVCTAGLVSFWYNPHFVMEALKLSFEFDLFKKVFSLFPLMLWLVPVASVVVFLLFNQVPARQPLFINLTIFLVTSLSLFAWYSFDFFVWPMPGRFVWEFLIGASLFGGFLLELLSARLGVFLKKKLDFEEWQLVVLVNCIRLLFVVLWAAGFASLFAKFYEGSLLELEGWQREKGLLAFIGLRYLPQMFLGFFISFATVWWIYRNRERIIS